MKRIRFLAALLATCALALVAASALPDGAPPTHRVLADHVPGEILVKFTETAQLGDRQLMLSQLGANSTETFRSRAERWLLGPKVDVAEAIERFENSPFLEYIEPNYVLSTDVVPNDARLNELWGMINTGQTGGTADADIDADLAWGVSTGSQDVLVAVIDTGIDYNHPDLAPNVWTNPGEIPGNGIDDDGNGFVDDVHGYDFVNNDGDPFDDNGHGTHCSGTIGAVGDNGLGVVGVNWNVTIMGLKFLSAGGSGSTADAVRAVDYAVMMGADLTSNSWGGGGYSQALYDAIAAANGIGQAFVAAAGNSSSDNDVSPHYPSSYDLPNVISVAATDHNDDKASFSSYGATSVDLGAPGDDILSTLPGNTYGLLSGTSMATPHVAGVAALIKAVSPDIPLPQLKSVLMNSTDPLPSMEGITVSGGRLNAFFAIAEPDDVPPGAVADLNALNAGSNTMELAWTATGDDGSVGTANFYEVRFSTSEIDELNFADADLAPGAPAPAESGAPETMEIRGLEASTLYYFALKAFDEWGNAGPISNLASGTTLPPPTAGLDPTSITDDLLTGEEADHVVTLSNDGVGTLDFTIPRPYIGEPMANQAPLDLGKDEADPRAGDPVTESQGGPDAFGYRWIDSDEEGGPAFGWIEISDTGTPVAATGDDTISDLIDLDFEMPFYGEFFEGIRVCSNGWLSFTDGGTAYSNQPLPSVGAPANLVAPFWDDLNPGGAERIYYESFGTYAVVQWTDMPRYSGSGTYTFQAILDSSGTITFQYLDLTGDLASATVGIQDGLKTTGLQVAFNQDYLHEDLALAISALPQWLSASPTSGRLYGGESIPINVHLDAAGLEGGAYPGEVNIETNDPGQPVLTVDVLMNVTGAPDAEVDPDAIDYGDTFLAIPKEALLTVRNTGTDVLNVTDIVASSSDLMAAPETFSLAPREVQEVVVTWTPSVLGLFDASLTIFSNDSVDPEIVVPVTGNAIPAPEIIVTPPSFDETLYTGQTTTLPLNVFNGGGSDLIVEAFADQGEGLTPSSTAGEQGDGEGGPDDFGYRWKDSNEGGGPVFEWIDISDTGTEISFSSSDDGMSPVIDMGMTFPFYGANFPSLRCSTNGWLTFDTSDSSARYSNSSLPSSSGAANMIAMFWDDLHLRSTGRVFYEYDGTRFILQYTDVERYSAGSLLNFQAILYPNGKIVLQYQSMSGTLDSATVGIQDGAKTIGLEVVYNDTYVQDGLAVRISRTPDWLAVAPGTPVTIPPGESFDYDVTFDATDRIGGDLFGNVILTTNIPSEPEVTVPATLHVIGVPVVGIIPESFDYGTRYAGYPHLASFQVVNTGTDVLNVSAVESTDPELLVEDRGNTGGEVRTNAAFSLAPGAARLFSLRWIPSGAGILDAEVQVSSDDPVTPVAVMPVTGESILPPVASWDPDSFSEALLVGESVNRTLHLENSGGSDLTYTLSLAGLGEESVTVYPPMKLGKDEEDPREGLLGTGGPDNFGYEWRDSDEPGGPVFDWFDISAIGTPIAGLDGDDENGGPVPIGFDFPFYGETFDTIRASTNGWLSFTNTTTDLSNDPLPNSGAPENLLAVFWDDLHFRYAERATYYNDGTRFIMQYTGVDQYSPNGQDYTFQVILHPNGRIIYQYLTMTPGDLAGATIGIQNSTRDDGLTVVYNSEYVHDGLAIEFRTPAGWLNVTPEQGTVPPGGSMDLDVRISAEELIGGFYEATIELLTNDPANGLIQVPVDLAVTGIPDIEVVPTSLTFPTTFYGFESTLNLEVRNVGTDVLTISDAVVDGDFSQDGLTPPVSLPVGGVIPVTVTFAPTTEGLRTGSLTITSDDPDESPVVVELSGEGLFPPEIGADPESIDKLLVSDDTGTETLTITNTGGSDLNWSSGTNIISASPAVPVYDELVLGKEEVDPRPGMLGSGGPDAFGYTWTDSDEEGGPAFDWVDISQVGERVPWSYSDDGNSGPVSIGFDFPFYGTSFDEVRIVTNGWLSFTSTRTSYSNQPLPNSGYSTPENLLAVFWDDLVHRSGTGSEPLPSAVYYYNDGERFIVQYEHMYRLASYSDDLNFQVILYPSGKVVFQYATMQSSTLNSNTIGIQNATKTDGLGVVYNEAYVHDNMAIQFQSIPEWMWLETTSGVIPAGESQEIQVNFDSTGLDAGFHDALIKLESNDPYTGLLEVPVTLNVNNPPTANAGVDATTECASFMGTTMLLDGSASTDPETTPENNDIVSYEWYEHYGQPEEVYLGEGMTLESLFSLGAHTVTLLVTDTAGWTDSDEVLMTVVDTIPPSGEITAPPEGACFGPAALPVTVEDNFTDICDPDLSRTYDPGPGPSYSDHGDYNVTLSVSDCSNNVSTDLAVFTIDTMMPTASFLQPPAETTIPQDLPFDILFETGDDDGALGDVVHEVVKLEGCVIYDGATFGNGDGLLSDEILHVGLGEMCRIANDCGFTSLVEPLLTVEATDCGGNLVVAERQLRGSMALRPGICTPVDIRLDGAQATVANWDHIEGVEHYDVVRGDVANLSVVLDSVDLGPVQCIESGSLDPSTLGNEDLAAPAPGSAFFYVVRSDDGEVTSSYGLDTKDRFRTVRPDAGDCL